MIKLRRRKNNQEASAEITPLIDIVFILLIFFMLTAVVAPQGISLDLPSAASSQPEEKQEIILSLDSSGKLYWDKSPIDLESLPQKLSNFDVKTPITLKADREVDYGHFVEVLDSIRKVGDFPLTLSTTRLQE